MTGAEFIAEFLATGRVRGVGIGSTVPEADRAGLGEYIEETDAEQYSVRRDYGLIALRFAHGVVTSGVIEVHRLAASPELAQQCRELFDLDFPRHLAWPAVAAAYRERFPEAPEPERHTSAATGYVEYRAAATGVSVLVAHGDGDGDGDVWSVSVGS